MPKVLVINGHGAKTGQKVQVNAQHSIITPGSAENSYVISFDNQYRHLEEMTSQNKIWPLVDAQKNPVQWHRYRDAAIDEIQISPLQDQFSFSYFANLVLNQQTKWENLSTPSHDVMQRSVLAVKMPNGLTEILEGKQLEDYLRTATKGTNEGRPLFFCDKELGKIKPMGKTSLSEVYAALNHIEEFKNTETEMIVATCSPAHSKGVQQIQVQTKLPPTEFAATAFIDVHAPQSNPASVSELEVANPSFIATSSADIPAGMDIPEDEIPAGIDFSDTPAGINSSYGESVPADVGGVSYEANIPAGADVSYEENISEDGSYEEDTPANVGAEASYSECISEKCNFLKSQLQSIKDPEPKLSTSQLESIKNHINALKKEKESLWCSSKDLKQVKIDALEQLIIHAETMSGKKAVEKIKKDYPQVMQGKISTRTADLLNSLLESQDDSEKMQENLK
ncbi:hypothetical protein [Legionella clemsonensis]|uniref:Dot/Icm T4SS effector n=1 Tax=Legionella clemsonensis TaxID=1867846 RepID=A0A222NZE7_9GAMM|nr:hypothetical protein [Legionella clemsonensis]ASQ44951.1 hypothetical protein clem_01940 [Legionella clemsonensis]